MEVKNFMLTLRITHNIIPARLEVLMVVTKELLTSEMLCCVVWCTHQHFRETLYPQDEDGRFFSVSTYIYQATQVSHRRRQ